MSQNLLTMTMFGVLVIPCHSLAEGEKAAARQSLGAYTIDVGSRFDCYFTIEDVRPVSGPHQSLCDTPVRIAGNKRSLAEVLDELREDLPTFDIVVPKENTGVVHIIDRRLVETQNNALNRRVTVDYRGGLQSLVSYLGTHLHLPVRSGSILIGMGPAVCDEATQVSVKGQGLVVRRALTDYLPLSQYNRLLWEATTDVIGGKNLETSVKYTGSFPPRPLVDGSAKRKVVDFSSGEAAYLANADGDGNYIAEGAVEAAMQFIDQQMKRGSRNQVRWAMLFLGKCGRAEAIPTLIRHIDFQYCNAGSPENRYPAFHALRVIGSSTVAPALHALHDDPDETRLALLFDLITSVEGKDSGLKAIQEEAMRVKEEEQRKRLLRAMQSRLP